MKEELGKSVSFEVPLQDVMDCERLAHADLEREMNKNIDAEIEKYIDNPILGLQLKAPYFSRPSNPSLYFIIPNELAERFCYYGFTPLMKNLFGKALGLNKYSYGMNGRITGEADTTIPNYYRQNFDVITYMTPIIGAIISDSYLDKFKTIMGLGVFYIIGMYLLAFSTNPYIFGYQSVIAPTMTAQPFNQTVIDAGIKFIPDQFVSSTPAWAIFTALGFIALGTGGIKPCVSAHGGDQFLDKQTFGLNQFYSFFYMAINVGAMVSSFTTPIIKQKQCFGLPQDCYSYAFLLSAIVFTVSYILFGMGKRYYRVVPPAGRFIIFDLIAASFTRLFRGREIAEAKYGKSLLVEAADLGKVLLAILPTPIFWMGFNQNSSTWQDSTDRLGQSIMNSEQLNSVVNPVLIVILAPLFNSLVYPYFPKLTLIRRICLGYLFAGLAFVVCALIEGFIVSRCSIDETLPETDDYFGKCAYKQIDNTIWIIPYFLITVGEVLVSISGLNFMYEEVGKRTKSSSTALWLLTSSLGSFIASQLTLSLSPGLRANDTHMVTTVQFYYICAAIIFSAIIPQGAVAWWYVPKAERKDIEFTKQVNKL